MISLWIFYEAYQRFQHPPDVVGAGVLVIGLVGVVANGIPVVLMLRAGTRHDLNLRGAMIHAATDVLGSAGAALSGLIIMLTGWEYADPLVGALIGVIILFSSWGLIRESLRILLEVAPGDCDPQEIGQTMAAQPGVKEVHDLHIWTITSGFPALSAHIVARSGVDQDRLLHDLEALIHERFDIDHTTLQIDRDHSQLITLQPRITRHRGVEPDVLGADGRKPVLRLGLRGPWRERFAALLKRISELAGSTVAQFADYQKKSTPRPWKPRRPYHRSLY